MTVLALGHEYVHGWEKDSMNMTDHIEREALAYMFTLMPNEFAKWRNETYPNMPKITASFPELNARSQRSYLNTAEKKYWNILDEKTKGKYQPLFEMISKLKIKLSQ